MIAPLLYLYVCNDALISQLRSNEINKYTYKSYIISPNVERFSSLTE